MTDAEFWGIIESGGPYALEEQDSQVVAIEEALGGLPLEEVLAFHRLFDEKLAAAYLWDLWGAAYLINGGCSDDGFHYFRCWLISQGRAAYEAAVANPDSLAGRTDPELDAYEFEELWSVARAVYRERSGGDPPAGESQWPSEPTGEPWDFDDDKEIRQRLPRLAEIYLE